MTAPRDAGWWAVYGAMIAAQVVAEGGFDNLPCDGVARFHRDRAVAFADQDAEVRAEQRGVDRLARAEMQANTNRIDPSCPGPFDPGGAFGEKP